MNKMRGFSFSKFLFVFAIIGFMLASLSCSFLVQSEEPCEIRVQLHSPRSNSSEYSYIVTDLTSCYIEVFRDDGNLHSFTGDPDEWFTTGEIRKGNYFISARGYDKAGTVICKTDSPLSVQLGSGDTAQRSIEVGWCALDSDSSAFVRFYDVEKESLIGKPVQVSRDKIFPSGKIPTKSGYNLECYVDSSCTQIFSLDSEPIEYSMTLWSKWVENENPKPEATKFTVNFDSNGGTELESQTVISGESAVEPNSPTKEGYIFEYWYLSDSAEKYDFNSEITADITLYAKWKELPPDTFVVTFDSDGGSHIESQTVESGGKVTKPTAPTKTGYTFVGWYLNSEKTTAYDFGTVVKSNITLYAKWNVNSYTVTFDTDGGTSIVSQTVTFGANVSEPAAPTKENYTFIGWYSDSEKIVVYDFTKSISGNITLYAKWSINSYTVTFDTDGGSAIESQSIEYGSKATKPADPAKTGYKFVGWYLNSEKTTAYDFENSIKSDITLYAKWEALPPDTFVVTFDSDGGTYVESQTIESGSKVTKPNEPTKTGYNFVGWYVDSNKTMKYNFESAVTSNIKLYAKWNVNSYTVSFDTDGGSAISSQTVESGSKVTKPADPTKDGYKFAGWYLNSGKTTAYDFESAVTNDITLYAKWEVLLPDTFIVTFDSDGGSHIESQTVESGSKVTKPADPTKDGYKFAGWYVNSEKTTAYDFTKSVTSDITLYAKWSINSYTVTFDTDGGSTVASQTVIFEHCATEPSTPTKIGYTFAGWYSDSEKTSLFDFETKITSSITLHAKWSVGSANYTVKHLFQNVSASAYEENSSYSSEQKSGKTGEQTSASAKTVAGFTAQTVEQKTIFADGSTVVEIYYNRKTIKYTFNSNDGAWASESEKILTGLYGATVSIENPTRTGYKFAGWNKTVPSVFGENDEEFNATWTPISYEINFEAGEGTGSMDSMTCNYDEECTLSANTFTRTGYAFKEWNGSDGKIYQNSASVKNLTVEDGAKITLSAQWEVGLVNYTVKHFKQNLENDEFTEVTESEQSLNGKTNSKTEAKANDYTGFTAKEFSQKTISADGSTIVEIRYERNKYSVTYDDGVEGENISVPAKKTYKYGATVDVNFTGIGSRSGYTFKGWKNGANYFYTSDGTTSFEMGDEDVTLTAQWEKITAGGISVTISENSDISIAKTKNGTEIILTADSGYTNYTWKIDGKSASSVTGVTVNGDVLTIDTAKIPSGIAYQITLRAKKGGILYSALVTVNQ